MNLFCFGFGYCARHLVAHMRGDFIHCAASFRDTAMRDVLREQNIMPVAWRETFDEDLLAGVTHILCSAPPLATGDDPLLSSAYASFVKHAPNIKWLGYLSTTGVYGDHDGAWVDEDSIGKQISSRGQRRVAAEQAWLDFGAAHNIAIHIFRLAGIYGPQRNAFRRLEQGTARRIEKPGHVFSRIHVEDIAQTLSASMHKPHAGRVYNLCDDEAAPPQDVVNFAARLMGVTPPPLIRFEAADLSPMARSFYADNKRVRNERIKTELGVRLRYPTYREGLRALWQDKQY